MSFDFRDFLSLERPAARTLMPFFYYLLVIFSALGGLIGMYYALRFNSLQAFLTALGLLLTGVLGSRILCEVLLAILDVRDRKS